MDIIQVNDSRILKALRRIKSRFSGDSHESVQVAPFGDDSCPPKGTKGVKTQTSTDAVHVILGYFNKNNIAEAGEKRIFSVQEDGTESVYIYLKNNGTFEAGCSDGFKITYDITNKRITVSGDVLAGIIGISLVNHTHTTPSGPSGPPIPEAT
jgi:hypothetical protein